LSSKRKSKENVSGVKRTLEWSKRKNIDEINPVPLGWL
jgi:hypothetical protein